MRSAILNRVSMLLACAMTGAWLIVLAGAQTTPSEFERLYVAGGLNAVLRAERQAAIARLVELEVLRLPDEEFDRLARNNGAGADDNDKLLAQLRIRADIQWLRSASTVTAGTETASAIMYGHLAEYGFRDLAIRGFRQTWLHDVGRMIVSPSQAGSLVSADAWQWADELLPAEEQAELQASVARNDVFDARKWGRIALTGMPMDMHDDILGAKRWADVAAIRYQARSAAFDSEIIQANGGIGSAAWALPIVGIVILVYGSALLLSLIRLLSRMARA